jgi:hypothetical protein
VAKIPNHALVAVTPDKSDGPPYTPYDAKVIQIPTGHVSLLYTVLAAGRARLVYERQI